MDLEINYTSRESCLDGYFFHPVLHRDAPALEAWRQSNICTECWMVLEFLKSWNQTK